jgi:hypothetical protein
MTISYNNLGSYGRIGNQMFQYAGLRGIASNRGFDFTIPPEDHDGDTNYCLFQCFKMTGVGEQNKGFSNLSSKKYKDKDFRFDEDLFNTCPDNVDLNGYFQSEKYFNHIEDEIRSDFQFRDDIYESCKEIMDEVGKSIFLHVRRGDYVRVQNYHPLMTESYYTKALERFDPNTNVVVLSDDYKWCKEQDIFKADRFFISESEITFNNRMQMGDGAMEKALIPFWDLCLMSMCTGGIIANSSMSWWGAWLINDSNKKIVAPDPNNWFGTMYDHYVMDDLIPNEWETIS